MSPSAGPGFVAVDSGGSGLRVVVGAAGRGPLARGASGEPVRTGARGIDPGHLMGQLVPMARGLAAEAGIGRLDTAAVGAAGLASLGDALRAELPGALARELGVRRVALAADAVTAYVGALGPRPGAVVAAGTGLIAVGTDLAGWRRADGWGHLLGDCGGGAWIGRAGLEAALRAHDGRDGGSGRLLECAEEMFGPATALPGHLYPRTDRPAVLASFAPRVAECADDDAVAADILRAAARHMADSAAAVCPEAGSGGGADAGPGSVEPLVALTGGLFHMGDPLLVPLDEELAKRLPRARRVAAEGDPLHGAVRIATDLAAGSFTLPGDEKMLWVTSPAGGGGIDAPDVGT
ncbi:BadF/BadG/BcrA/BcrD ATPase family protein [Streptomyces sp. GD-15H]|uniref:N-acetylglucosamine kinase n=1 Tax=Streptomyces sp. GD-15H TaxID=3129112 RepID=UPI003251A0FA